MAKAEKITAWILGSISLSLTAVILWWAIRDPSRFIEEQLGIVDRVFTMPLAWIVALAIGLGYIAFTAVAEPVVRKNLFRFSWLKAVGICAAVVTGIVEEVVFRQLLMDWLLEAGLNAVLQIAISAVVFGLAHACWVMLRGDARVAVPVVLSTIVLGGLLAGLYILADRSTLPSIAAHTIVNLGIEPWLILAVVSGGRWDTQKQRNAPTSD